MKQTAEVPDGGPFAGLGDWKNTQRRFCRWRDKGLWEGLLKQVTDDPV